jgi:hypothetical protein
MKPPSAGGPDAQPRILHWRAGSTEGRPAGLEVQFDYLWCPNCRVHVPCARVPSGGWEVQCPGCAGECGICDCHLRRFCFGSRDQFPPLRV